MPEFRQDLKRYEKKKRSASDVWKVVKFIQSGGELPDNLDAKQLREPYQEFWGCHIKADLILIYRREADGLILYRLGTHKELYELD